MANAQHEFDFGDFALVPANPSGKAWTTNTLAELDFGNPEPVVAPIQSLLQDGSLAEILSHENRSIVIRVEISGPDLAAVEDGELALMAEVNKGRNVLRWQPPDSFAHPIIFDVIWSRLDFAFNDLDELRPVRTFTITLNCAPFGRDAEETVVEAITTGEVLPSPTPATVDACTSATGWAYTYTTSIGGVITTGPTVVSGVVRATLQRGTTGKTGPGPVSLTLTRTGLSADMTSTPFLVVSLATYYSQFTWTGSEFTINGTAIAPIGRSGNLFYFDCSAIPTITSFSATTRFLTRALSGDGNPAVYFDVQDLTRTNMPPFVGTGRQQFRQFTVGGSARTQGSIQLAHETAALGDVLVYTCAADDAGGSQPPLRQYRTAGDATPSPDASTASGASTSLNSGIPETFDVPANAVAEGTHSLMAIVKSAATGWKAITVAVSSLVGGNELGGRTQVHLVNLTTTAWTVVELGRVTLPPVALPPGSTSFVRIKMSSTDAVSLDEALIFHGTKGALTWVKCGTGTPAAGGPSSRAWLDTATLDRPDPAIWLGTTANGSDSRHAIGLTEVPHHGTHMLEPGLINLYTLTLGATNAAASARYFRRWQHNAAA